MKFIGVDGSPQLLQLVLALQPRPTLFHDLPRSDVVVQSPQDSPLLQPRAPPLNFTWQKLLRSDLLFPLRTPLALISNTSAPCPFPLSPVARSRVALTARATRWPSAHIHPQVIALFWSSFFVCLPPFSSTQSSDAPAAFAPEWILSPLPSFYDNFRNMTAITSTNKSL